jgi:hypothetical protein
MKSSDNTFNHFSGIGVILGWIVKGYPGPVNPFYGFSGGWIDYRSFFIHGARWLCAEVLHTPDIVVFYTTFSWHPI